MAWITKNSATMEVERRDTPYLDDAMKRDLEPIVARYPSRRAASLPVLHAIQHAHGHLPYQAIEEAADFLEVTFAQMLDTATFYDEYFVNEPKGRYVIWVCQSISCELLGATSLMAKLREKLGIEPGQTTEDGKFTLKHVQCLGACGGAPCALVNEKLHENITVDNFERVLDGLE